MVLKELNKAKKTKDTDLIKQSTQSLFSFLKFGLNKLKNTAELADSITKIKTFIDTYSPLFGEKTNELLEILKNLPNI